MSILAAPTDYRRAKNKQTEWLFTAKGWANLSRYSQNESYNMINRTASILYIIIYQWLLLVYHGHHCAKTINISYLELKIRFWVGCISVCNVGIPVYFKIIIVKKKKTLAMVGRKCITFMLNRFNKSFLRLRIVLVSLIYF